MAEFIGRNDLSPVSRLMFERGNYKTQAFPERGGLGPKNVLDFNFAERNLYGRIDQKGEPVIPRSNILKQVVSPLNPQSTMTVQNFLADAFTDFANHMYRACTLRIINTEHPYLSSVEPVRAYASPYKLYREYMAEQMAVFNDTYLRTDPELAKVLTFSTYIKKLAPFLKMMGQKHPLTFSGWHRSVNSNIFTSGIALDIAGLSHSDDEVKNLMFLEDNNFPYYIKLLRYYGMAVSKNAPWVIVADLSSPAMQPYMKRYELTSVGQVFSRNFTLTRPNDINFLKEVILENYNAFVRIFPYERHMAVCKKGNTRTTIQQRNLTNIELINNNYDYRFFNNLYIDLRNIEERMPFKPADIKRIKKNANFFHKKLGAPAGSNFINEQFRSLYKFKDGNVHSIKKKLKMKKEKSFQLRNEMQGQYGQSTPTDDGEDPNLGPG